MSDAVLRLAIADALTPVVPLILARQASGAVEGIVSPMIGYPYTLDTVTVWLNRAVVIVLSFEIRVADDPDLTDLTRLTGDVVYRHRRGTGAGEASFPFHNTRQTFQLQPRTIIRRAPTFIKVRFQSVAATDNVAFIFQLIPLPEAA